MSSSCRRKRPQHLPLELEKQYTKLLSKVSLLSATRCSLSHENSLVAVLCDSLLYVQPLASGQQDGKEQQLTELLEAEGQLLQRLGRVPAVPVDQHLELLREAGVDGQGHPVLKLFTERPLVEKGARLTALDMTLVYKQMVQELAVHLQLLDAGMLEPVACAERIRGSCDSLLHHLLSCMMLGLSTVMRQYTCTDAATLGPPKFEAAAAHGATAAAASGKVHMTNAQEQALAEVTRVYGRLCAPLDQEIQALKQQLCADEGCWSSGSSISSGSSSCTGAAPCISGAQSAGADAAPAAAEQAAPADASSVAGGSSAVEMTTERAAAIEMKMQQVDRLQAVDQKRCVLRVACWAYALGRLSWVQLARLAVLTWPYPCALEDVCAAIQRRLDERQQQQREQDRKQKVSAAPADV